MASLSVCVLEWECCPRSPYLQESMIPYCLRGLSTYMRKYKRSWPFYCVSSAKSLWCTFSLVCLSGGWSSRGALKVWCASIRATFVICKHNLINFDTCKKRSYALNHSAMIHKQARPCDCHTLPWYTNRQDHVIVTLCHDTQAGKTMWLSHSAMIHKQARPCDCHRNVSLSLLIYYKDFLTSSVYVHIPYLMWFHMILWSRVTSHDLLCCTGLCLYHLHVHLTSCPGNCIWRDNGRGNRQFDWWDWDTGGDRHLWDCVWTVCSAAADHFGLHRSSTADGGDCVWCRLWVSHTHQGFIQDFLLGGGTLVCGKVEQLRP